MVSKISNFALIVIFGLLPSIAVAHFDDHDGHLVVGWQPPAYGNPLDHYIWSYTINGVADSLIGTSFAGDTLNSSVILAYIGDWAIFNIRAISVVNDTSIAVSTDTAYYDNGLNVDPPMGVTWI